MIGKETIEGMTKTLVNSLHKQRVRNYDWDDPQTSEVHREAYRKAMKEVVKSVGAKVEGEPE